MWICLSSPSTKFTTPSWIYFKQLWYVNETHCISLIQGLPNRILYCMISPSITCSNVCTIFDPIVIGNEIDPIVEHKERWCTHM